MSEPVAGRRVTFRDVLANREFRGLYAAQAFRNPWWQFQHNCGHRVGVIDVEVLKNGEVCKDGSEEIELDVARDVEISEVGGYERFAA